MIKFVFAPKLILTNSKLYLNCIYYEIFSEPKHKQCSSRLLDVFPQGMGFVLVFEFMVSDLSEMIRDAFNPLTTAQVNMQLDTLVDAKSVEK